MPECRESYPEAVPLGRGRTVNCVLLPRRVEGGQQHLIQVTGNRQQPVTQQFAELGLLLGGGARVTSLRKLGRQAFLLSGGQLRQFRLRPRAP